MKAKTPNSPTKREPSPYSVPLFRKEDYISLLKIIKNKVNIIEIDDLTKKLEGGDFSDVYNLARKITIKEFSKKI